MFFKIHADNACFFPTFAIDKGMGAFINKFLLDQSDQNTIIPPSPTNFASIGPPRWTATGDENEADLPQLMRWRLPSRIVSFAELNCSDFGPPETGAEKSMKFCLRWLQRSVVPAREGFFPPFATQRDLKNFELQSRLTRDVFSRCQFRHRQIKQHRP